MEHRFKDQSSLRKYRTEIPNLFLDIGLSPYEFTLYAHMKRTAGDNGECYKSTATLAKAVGCSVGKIKSARDALIDRGLITAERPDDRRKTLIIRIIDWWPENMKHFSCSPDGDSRSPGEHECSCGDHKERTLIRNVPKKKSTPLPPKVEAMAIIELWNSIITKLPKVQKATDSRIKAVLKALKSDPETDWAGLFMKINDNPFLCGQCEDGSEWPGANFDWLFCRREAQDNRARIIEGNYDRKKKGFDSAAWARGEYKK